MADDLYEHDVLAWSIHQATLLRRIAAGERVNDIDWAHVAEEIEDVGLSQLNVVKSYARQILTHLLKLHGWPDLSARAHWRGEIATFQSDLADRFTPSMRQRMDMEVLYARAIRQVEPLRLGGKAARTPPPICPVTLDQLLTASYQELEAAFLTLPQ